MTPPTSAYSDQSIVFFDGVCGLCNNFVDRLLHIDKQRKLRFSPLQGETAEELLPDWATQVDSIVYYHRGKTYVKSSAALRIAHRLGGMWHLVGLLWPFQWLIGDWVYDWVARNRYEWFGKLDACRLPTPEERAVFMP